MELKKINLVSMRHSNKETVLAIIRKYESISRAEIAQRLDISKSVVSSIVSELISEGIVFQTRSAESKSLGGRRPIGLRIVPNGRYSIGIDITATQTNVMLVDLSGSITAKKSINFHVTGMDTLRQVLKLVEAFISECSVDRSKIVGAGVGVPGSVNYQTGEISSSPLKVENEDVRTVLSKILPGQGAIVVDNDANMAVVGERWKGYGANCANIVLISAGLGIGAGLILNGEVYRGSNNYAGEIGYFEVDPYVCSTSRSLADNGALEDIASEEGVVLRARSHWTRLSGSEEHSVEITYEDVVNAARNGDLVAEKIMTESLIMISFAISQIVSLLNPDVVLIGGAMSKFSGEYVERIRARVRQLTPISTEILAVGLGEDATALGGAASAFIDAGYLQLG